MINPNRDIASFTLRFVQHRWKDSDDEPRVQWRGSIQHVQSDEEISFTEFAEALNFIQKQLTNLTVEATSEDSKQEQDKFVMDSFRLWETFASNYTDMIFSAMENTIKGSEALQEKMQETAQYPFIQQNPFVGKKESELVDQIRTLQSSINELDREIKAINQRLDEISG